MQPLDIIRGPSRWRTDILVRFVLGLSFALVLVLAVRPAGAQSSYFYLDRAQLSGAPDDGFMVFRPYMPRHTRFYGTAALGYTHNPLRAETVTDNPVAAANIDNPIQGQFILYPMAGVQLMNRVGASISLPLAIANATGEDPQRTGVGEGGMDDVGTAFHDLRLDLRVRTFETDDGRSRFGGGFAVWAPTGNATAFAGDNQVSGWLFGSAEFDLRRFFFAGHIGPHFRPEGSIGGPRGALFVGSELRWAFGIYMPLREGKIRLGGELFGTTGLDSSAGSREVNTIFSGRNTALEWLGQARFLLEQDPTVFVSAGLGTRLSIGYGAPDFRLLVSIGKYLELSDRPSQAPPRKLHIVPEADDYDMDTDGDGFPDAIDKCPSIKEDGNPPETSDGCPGSSDRDKDGIADAEDACPDKTEDKDGVQDEDGCPEEDADNDGILDQNDKCPTQAGPGSQVAEKHGCPSLTRVSEESGDVELLSPIEFEFGKTVVKASSYPILDEVVTLMKSRPSLRIGVYGHTDSHGAQALNMRLSRERAAACMQYVVEKGVAADRLESNGYGSEKPIADNETPEGRSRNRRVEFKILSSD